MSITLCWGPMFSGKTSWGQREVLQAELRGETTLSITYAKDNRYSRKQLNVSHDHLASACVKLDSLETLNVLDRTTLIWIDEAQFMEGLYDFCMRHRARGITILLTGLQSDIFQKPWPRLTEMTSVVDDVVSRKANCIVCNKECIFTRLRFQDENAPLIKIGTDDYVPACHDHLTCAISDELIVRRKELLDRVRLTRVAVI